MLDSNLSMIVSNRQKDKPIVKELEKLGIVLRYANLKVGGFLISGKMAVEVESAEDFLTLISNKILFRKLIDFKRDFPEAVYIIEGFSNLNGKMNSPKVRSAISYITILNHLPVIVTSDAVDTAQYLNLLARQAQHGLTFEPENDKNKEKQQAASDPRLAIVQMLPEVGKTTAKTLLKHFKTLERLFSAKVPELVKVQGIGKKKAEKLRNFIQAKYRK